MTKDHTCEKTAQEILVCDCTHDLLEFPDVNIVFEGVRMSVLSCDFAASVHLYELTGRAPYARHSGYIAQTDSRRKLWPLLAGPGLLLRTQLIL